MKQTSRVVVSLLVAAFFSGQAAAHTSASSSILFEAASTAISSAPSSRIGTPEAAPVSIPRWRKSRPENLQAEAFRLATLHKSAFGQGRFGGAVQRGFLLKDLRGPVLLQSNANMEFQPASTLKVVPYAVAIDYARQGKWQDLESETVNWVAAAPGSNRQDNPCDVFLKQYAGVSKISRSATLDEALPTMMYYSDNAIHEAMLRKIGPVALNEWLKSKGIWNTRQFYGCRYGHNHDWWRFNRTTLNDLSKLYQMAWNGSLFGWNHAAKTFFKNNLVHSDSSDQTFHKSSIRDFEANYSNEVFRPVVEIEAALLGKDSFVDEFMKHLVWRDKGGAGSSGRADYAESGFGVLSVPHRVNGRIEMRHYALGIFSNNIFLPHNCDDDAACKAELERSRAVQRRIMQREMPIEPVRRALQTWTLLDRDTTAARGRTTLRVTRP